MLRSDAAELRRSAPRVIGESFEHMTDMGAVIRMPSAGQLQAILAYEQKHAR